jgi:hypothetical protein
MDCAMHQETTSVSFLDLMRGEVVKNMVFVQPFVDLNRRAANGTVRKMSNEAERVANDLADLTVKRSRTLK